jgi:DNA-binding winged helix-turn-helix (wHTH) protein/tetratricopeptide (TPR) repeat protein
MQEPQCLVFGPFRLDLRDERLWRGPEATPLSPKTFAVLRCLVTQAGQLVTKDALLEAVWPETAVSESVVTVAMRTLRRVLGDQARTPRFIETVHGRGYRFIAPVHSPAPPGGPAGMEALHSAPLPRFRRPLHFVGRDVELAQLMQWWTTARQGTRQVGVIAGEPGIGKTALVEAFLAQVAAGGDCRVGHGQCIEPYGPGEPYLPVLEAFGRLCREPDGSSLVSVLRQYAPSWLVQMPALLPPAEWEALQRTVGHPVQTRMLRELTEALDALTTARPLVLVLEDLHWSDRATLERLAYVARRPDPARLMILGTYRPVDAIVQAHPLRAVLAELQQHGQCVELALDYLSEVEVTAYLRQRFGGSRLAADLARVLHQRTHGNPLFLIAVVDEIVRQQVVREGPAGWAMRGGVETITMIIPATLRGLIEQQLAHCSPEEQTLLAAASVAGAEFAAAAVAAGLEHADDEIEAQCATLAHHGQFLQARGRAEWPDGTVTACFGFRHVLYHDILYQRIPAGRQTRWHARIGSRLAQGFGAHAGDMAAALAMHFVRGRMLPQAIQYSQQAGQIAARRAAYHEAVTYYEQALHALQQLPPTPDRLAQAIDLRLALQDVLFPLGTHDRIVDTLHEAERLAEALGDHQRLGWVTAELSGSYRQINTYDQAVALAQRAVTLAVTIADDDLHAWALLRLGQVAYFQGDYHRASDCFREAIAFSAANAGNAAESTFLPAHARSWLVYCLTQRGEFDEGLALGTEAVRLAEGGDFPTSRCAAYASCGNLSLIRGDCARAITFLERGLDLCRRWHSLDWFPECATSLGLVYALAGHVADACPLLEQAVAQEATMAGGYKAIWLIKLGQGSLLVGRLAEARAQAERALRLSHERRERGFQAWALWLLGAIAAQGDPPEAAQAEASYQQALTLAEELGMRPLQAHCHRSFGTLCASIGQREQARTALSAAMALYRAMDMTFWLLQAEAALAQVEVGSFCPCPTTR